MKKFIFAILAIAVLSTPAMAADITLEIVIQDAWVARTNAAFNSTFADYPGDGSLAEKKVYIENILRQYGKQIVLRYENRKAWEEIKDQYYQELTLDDIWSD
jgi:opacity protein-like surface antigen